MYFITYLFIVIFICCKLLKGPKLFSQTTFPLTRGADTEVLTERRLKVRFSFIYICILMTLYYFITIFLRCALLNFSHRQFLTCDTEKTKI